MKNPNAEMNKVSGRKFSDMNISEKLKFVGKACLFLITGGFMFPTMFSE